MGGEQGLSLIPDVLIHDRRMLALVNWSLVGEPADIDRIGNDLVEMPSADQSAAGPACPAPSMRIGGGHLPRPAPI